MKVTGIFNIKGRGWVITVHCPPDIELPEIGDWIIDQYNGWEIGTIRGIDITRGEDVGFVIGSNYGHTMHGCTDVEFQKGK